MKPTPLKIKSAVALALAATLASGFAMAEKPSWAGGGKSDRAERSADRDDRSDKRHGGDHHKNDRRDGDDRSSRDGGRRQHFEDRHRVAIHDYYDHQYQRGRCPPGLAKKHNGCMPPGQAKKWQVGHQLPHDVVYHTVPQQLVLQIGQPPQGYRYVRVASDILLMAIGTRMVVDAIQDLGRS